MKSEEKQDIKSPKIQLNLYGYDRFFNCLKTLYYDKKLPNVLLLSGHKGIGKSTFVYHFINYILSQNEDNKYSIKNFSINSKNSSYQLLQNNINPNFFLLDKTSTNENIKIEQVRNLLKFLNKTTHTKSMKLVLIDNSESLNLNASNALLKSIEQPSENTFFFIIHNHSSKLIETIKSRSVLFKIHFSCEEKKNIFNKIMSEYEFNDINYNFDNFLRFDSPGNCLGYISLLKDSGLNISKDFIDCIYFLAEQYKIKSDSKILFLLSFYIENFYHELSLKNKSLINNYFVNKNKLLYLISNKNKFNLDSKNLLFNINKTLNNEK